MSQLHVITLGFAITVGILVLTPTNNTVMVYSQPIVDPAGSSPSNMTGGNMTSGGGQANLTSI